MYREQQSFLEIKKFESWLIETRRKIHINPELSEQEWATQELIEALLDEMGIAHKRYAQTGVVAILEGGISPEGSCVVGIRADIDALPINELTASVYQSKRQGIMHACGHDAHTTILLGTLKYLKAHQNSWSGTVKGFFQPAEETIGGAKRMVEAGCMDTPKVDYVLGLHVMPYLEVGQIETREGKLNAASDGLQITVKGKAAHGAYPEKGVDAINISAQIQMAISNLMSRQLSPLDQAVVSINQINGGVKDNIICDEVIMSGMMRTTDETLRKTLKDKIIRVSEAIARSNDGDAVVTFSEGYQALINDVTVTKQIKKIANQYLGEKNVFEKEAPSLGVEDFSFFLDRAQGAFYHLGCGNKSKNLISALHTDTFDIDESCLALGVFLQCEMSLSLLKQEV
ncbi:M20 family metallopeptidase [Fusibacter sp. 3D3]|uniref:M20 metallopeptidase family protein n=1 Tax=Fusibacter sp. 3D3 TaxID=1048380 RepID=UPI000853398E|nr:M20 family metallopeptidase [Fusibacter sp. 3D3]GAU77224.1 N-acetyl-L,L-diaminopimelate deacetylase [Fusibacter sp. 3D3]